MLKLLNLILFALLSITAISYLINNQPSSKLLNIPTKELKVIVSQFEADSIKYNHPAIVDNLTIIISDELDNNTNGVCSLYLVTPTIYLNIRYINHEKLKRVVYHELGHCILNRRHKDTKVSWGMASLMSTILLDKYVYEQHEDYYLNELFNEK